MEATLVFVAALAGYFIGALSFARIFTHFISRQTNLQDIAITNEKSGESIQKRPSAASVSMALGWKAGCAVSLLDMLKVTSPVLAVKLLLPEQPYYLVTAAFAVLGNNWPVYYRFRGGAGISSIYGGLLVVDPLAIVVPALAGLLVGLLILRSFLVMFLLSLLLVIPWLWYRFENPAYWMYAVSVNVVYLITMTLDTIPYLRTKGPIMKERDVMAQMPMGRGMIKMMEYLRFPKPHREE